ncbi:helix-turn-helix domain-containing protein [Sanguibacter massiliensis]|uniref:helix-turn-helix domain-containing protein n=1 Tax=Sanguibacter massiliensis TaxID=1973217 RepID=UPI001F5CF9D5|nr:XRE family transcriptional regulator [Sanguibacter massiliensis]
MDLLILGRRIRHFRTAADLTLDDVAATTGLAPSQLSQIENGKREPRISALGALAEAFGVTVPDLLSEEPPSQRAALEIELDRAQRGSTYGRLGLPEVKASQKLPQPVLESLVGLHRELARRDREAVATPEAARAANLELRTAMRERDNHLPEIEAAAEDLVRRAGYVGGPLTHRTVARAAELLGFEILHTDELPRSTRTVTDLASGRIYLPPASIPGGHGLRALALQALAHRVLEHRRPESYKDFLRQRLEINYFASACLVPRSVAVPWLLERKKERDLAVSDFRDAFGVSHDAAAQRFTNLATVDLGIHLHYLRVTGEGMLLRGYENDGVRFPTDVTGAIEGQTVCRSWAARQAFASRDRTSEYYQYTDKPGGTYWCSTQTGTAENGEFSISVGVPFTDVRWFRGRETDRRMTSTCPDAACCQRPAAALEERWADAAWPSAKMHQHVLAALPTGRFPGVDDAEVYRFLESHAPTDPTTAGQV